MPSGLVSPSTETSVRRAAAPFPETSVSSRKEAFVSPEELAGFLRVEGKERPAPEEGGTIDSPLVTTS